MRPIPSIATLHTISFILLYPAIAQTRSATELIEGNWEDPEFGCNKPGRITVFGEQIQFVWTTKRTSGGEYVVEQVVEKITSSGKNTIKTVAVSLQNSQASKGDTFEYQISDNKLLIRNLKTGNQTIHIRCN